MKLSKAVEIKEIYYKSGRIPCHSDYGKADRLSIEAMKRLARIRRLGLSLTEPLLPGETEE